MTVFVALNTNCNLRFDFVSHPWFLCFSREMNDRLVRKEKELGGVQQKLIDAVEEEKTIVEERLRNSAAERRPLVNGRETGPSDDEDTGKGRRQSHVLRVTVHWMK